MSNYEFEGMFHPDDMPDHYAVIVASEAELNAKSGIFDAYNDHRTGEKVTVELSNLQAIELFEVAGHQSQGLFLEHIPDTDKCIVISKRPTELQAKERAKMLGDLGINADTRPHSYTWRPETYY